jgi:hypothetical protein
MINVAIIPDEIPEQNEKTVNEIIYVLKKFGRDTLSNYVNALTAIALQCPYSGGKPVYQARAILEYMDVSHIYDDYITCLQEGIYRQSAPNINTVVSINDFEVLPNPTKDKINVVIKNKIEGKCMMEILGTTGNLVHSSSFNCNERIYTTDISRLDEGMYYVRVTFNNEYRFVSKLAIIR